MASWAEGPPRDRWCLDLEELDEFELALPLKSCEILLIFSSFVCVNCADR